MKRIARWILLSLIVSSSFLNAERDFGEPLDPPRVFKDDKGNSVTVPQAGALEELRMDVTWSGDGGIKDLFVLVDSAVEKTGMNVIYEGAAGEMRIPPFKVTSASFEQVAWLMTELSDHKLAYTNKVLHGGAMYYFEKADKNELYGGIQELKSIVEVAPAPSEEERAELLRALNAQAGKAQVIQGREIIALSVGRYLLSGYEAPSPNAWTKKEKDRDRLTEHKGMKRHQLMVAIEKGFRIMDIEVPEVAIDEGTETIFVVGTQQQVRVAKIILEGVLDKPSVYRY